MKKRLLSIITMLALCLTLLPTAALATKTEGGDAPPSQHTENGPWNITIADGIVGGTVTADKNTAAEGELVTLTVTPHDGYTVQKITYQYGDLISELPEDEAAFWMPNADITVFATFKQVAHNTVTVNAEEDANVTLTVDDATVTSGATVQEGKKVTVTVPLDHTVKSVSVKLNGTELTGTDGVYTFTMPAEAATIEVTVEKKKMLTAADFTLIAHDLTYTGAGLSEMITVIAPTDAGSVSKTYYQGDTQVFDLINAGTYTVKVTVTSGTEYQAVTDLEIGTVTIKKTKFVWFQKSVVNVKANPEEDITVENELLNYRFVSVEGTFALKEPVEGIMVNEQTGKVTIAGGVAAGTTATIIATVPEGDNNYATTAEYTLRVADTNADIVSVGFQGQNGYIDFRGGDLVVGETVTIQVTPHSRRIFAEWREKENTASGKVTVIENAGQTWTVTITEDMADKSYIAVCKAVKEITAQTTASSYTAGSDPLTEDDFEVTATVDDDLTEYSTVILPSDAYTVDVTGVTMSEPGEYTAKIAFKNDPTTTTTAVVLVEAEAYKITVSVTEHGTVVPNVFTQQAGSDVSVTVNADAGYKVSSVRFTGERSGEEVAYEIDENGIYHFIMPNDRVTIKAVFIYSNAYGLSVDNNPFGVDGSYTAQDGSYTIKLVDSYHVADDTCVYATSLAQVLFDVIPADGYAVDKVLATYTIGENTYTVTCERFSSTANLYFVMPDAPVDISVTLKPCVPTEIPEGTYEILFQESDDFTINFVKGVGSMVLDGKTVYYAYPGDEVAFTVESSPLLIIDGVSISYGYEEHWSETVDGVVYYFFKMPSAKPYVGVLSSWRLGPFVVTYNRNYASVYGDDPIPAFYYEGSTVTLPTAESCPYYKEHYYLTGWKDNEGNFYQLGSEFTMPAHDVAFTAQWMLYTVGFTVTENILDGEENVPVAGAEIITRDPNGKVITVTTDEMGEASMELPAGLYSIEAVKIVDEEIEKSCTIELEVYSNTRADILLLDNSDSDDSDSGDSGNNPGDDNTGGSTGGNTGGSTNTPPSSSDDDDDYYTPSTPPVSADDNDNKVTINPFVDVSEDAYYFDAVQWAYAQGITSGTSAATFSPDASCTRAQMATFLWKAAGSPEPKNSVNPFADVNAESYYAKAVQWAYEQGITGGTSATTYSPDAPCTRAQMATFIYHLEQANGGGFTGAWMFRVPFADLPEWAFEPIAWCYMKGITSGTSATTFSPDATCTRAQMVTFLYRYFGN